jgi:hypothetical protein
MRVQAEPEQPMLEIAILGKLRHGSGVDHPAVVHDRDRVAERLGEHEILLDQQDGRGGLLPLVGSSVRNSLRGSMTARAIESICFCPPDRNPAGSDQNVLSAGNSPNTHRSRAASMSPARAASSRFSRTVRSAKIPMFSGT